MLDFTRFQAITFDCYGTLIDWERGLLDALRPFMERARAAGRAAIENSTLLERYAAHEGEAEKPPYRSYREVQRFALAGLAQDFGFEVKPGEEDAISESIANWPAFSDTAGAMRELQKRYKLCVCSNVDRDLFATSAPKLGVTLDALVTAEDVRSYKPQPGHFERAPRALGVARERILHVAQSLYHDIRPAREMGYATVWVNRQRGRWGATLPVALGEAKPDLEVPDLATLAEMATAP